MVLERASEALRLATVEPVRARSVGSGALRAAEAAGDWAAASVARRALGVAALQLNDIDAAVAHLRTAVSFARRAGHRERSGEARMSLASALLLRGQPRRAVREIDGALGELAGVPALRALTQRAAILQEIGRVDEALDDLRRALPGLRRAQDAQWATRALSNRSLLYVRKRAFAYAEADLVEAAELCATHGLALAGVYVEQNLGYLKAQRGDVPGALAHFDAAEASYRERGMEVAALLVDRGKLLLSVRLVREARAAAEAAVAAYERQKRRTHLPEAQLLLSTVALVEGDHATARRAADQAVANLIRLGRREWLALARYARLQAADPDQVTAGDARRVAAQLRAAGWVVPALDAGVLAGRLALRRGQRAEARRDLAAAGRARSAGPAEARAQAWLAEALLREADGNRRRARSAVRAGLRMVEEYRATLGATELRAHVSVHRGDLAELGLRMAVQDRDARAVLDFAERARASALLFRPAHPPGDDVLAGHLSDLRATVTEIQQRRESGRSSHALAQRQLGLERAIRDHTRVSPARGVPVARPGAPVELADRLGAAALVEYVELDGQLWAVTLVAGRVRLHALGPTGAVRHEMEHLPFALYRLANRGTRAGSRAAAGAVLARSSSLFDRVLAAPLRRTLGDRPLVIVPSPSLQSLPWSVVPSYAQRPLVVSPSATLWQAAADLPARPPDRVVIVAGPGLAGAEREAAAVGALYPGAVRLTGDGATAAALSAAMDGAALLHLAAHGAVRSDNPLFSSLVMADGPFTVYDLERLHTAPGQVVLAACDTGRTHALAGGEILGFAAALLSGGTATLVAPVIPVPDAETAPVMQAYHANLRAGRTPAQALALAQAEVRADDPVASAGAAGFVCLGDGHAP
jgi:tetratricopeptide (TPR) repeat protein